MDKTPVSIAIAITRKNIVDAVSNSGLPASILTLLLQDIGTQIAMKANEELQASYAEYAKEAEKENEEKEE